MITYMAKLTSERKTERWRGWPECLGGRRRSQRRSSQRPMKLIQMPHSHSHRMKEAKWQ